MTSVHLPGKHKTIPFPPDVNGPLEGSPLSRNYLSLIPPRGDSTTSSPVSAVQMHVMKKFDEQKGNGNNCWRFIKRSRLHGDETDDKAQQRLSRGFAAVNLLNDEARPSQSARDCDPSLGEQTATHADVCVSRASFVLCRWPAQCPCYI